MQKEIGKLKREITKAPVNERGRRRYGPDLRARVVRVAKQWRSDGNVLRKLAGEIGIRDSILSTWMRKADNGSESDRTESVAVQGEILGRVTGL